MKDVGSIIAYRTLNGERRGKIREIIKGSKILKITTATVAYLVELENGKKVVVGESSIIE